MKKTIALLLAVLMLAACTAGLAEAEIAPGLTGELEEVTESEESAESAPAGAEEAPELRLAGVRIGIDPGHQAHANSQKEAVAPGSKTMKAKVSSGTAGCKTGIAEYVTVLEIAFKLRDALEAQGAEVYMTRESHDVDISNQERAIMMNDLGVDLVLRIHCDGSEKRKTHGIGMYVNATGDIAEESLRAAHCLMPAMCEATGAREFGIYQFDTYTGLNWSTVPCILVECGFMSNPEEDVLLNTPEYQQKLADGMVEGVAAYMGR